MFLGEYIHTIDDKGRLTIPAKYRADLAAGVVITRGFEQNLIAFPVNEWEAFAQRIMERPLSDQDVREFRRRLFSGAVDLIPDRQGREIFRGVRIDRSGGRKPIVGVVGEIYVRSNRFCNNDIVALVERLGGEAWVAPVTAADGRSLVRGFFLRCSCRLHGGASGICGRAGRRAW